MFSYIRCNRGSFPQMFDYSRCNRGLFPQMFDYIRCNRGLFTQIFNYMRAKRGRASTETLPFRMSLQRPFNANRVWMYQ